MRWIGFALLGAGITTILHAQAEWPRPKWEEVETVGCRSSQEGKPLIAKIGAYEVRIVAEGGESKNAPARPT